jgi:hypothetical protein
MLAEMELPPADAMDELVSRPEWQLACRIAASKGLSKSERLPRFLLYICELHLLGRSQEITEQRIGIHIFGRSTDYNPGEDNIVRSYARLLRKRLDLYFEGEGVGEPMRIAIPRGGYVPVFEDNLAQGSGPEGGLGEDPQVEVLPVLAGSGLEDLSLPWDSQAAAAEEALLTIRRIVASAPVRRWRWVSLLLGLAAGALLASAGWWAVYAVQARRELGPSHVLWTQLFQRDRNTIIVPSDSGLGILQNLTRRLVGVEEYASGSYLTDMASAPGLDPHNRDDLTRERYTSVVSLNITSRISRLPEYIADRTQVRYARSIGADDIRNSNVILLGSKHTDPWVALFEKRLAFQLEYTPEVDESYVLNEHPAGGEQKIYRNSVGTSSAGSSGAASNHTYGAIAYLPSLDGAGHVLIIQGLNMAATQAAADTLFNAGEIQPVLRQAVLPDGTLRPFELLVETTSIGATAPGAQIIATRFYSQ